VKKLYKTFVIALFLMITMSNNIEASELLPLPDLSIGIDSTDQTGDGGVVTSLQILFLFALITMIPSLLITMSCFTRIIISLHFVRSALGTQQMPPNQVLIGLALFITLFLMGPTISKINENALQPYSKGEISQEQFFTNSMEPIREFMLRQVEVKDIVLFLDLDKVEFDGDIESISNRVLIPSFILGEITKGFKIGFIIYLPFIVIDMVVASVLMAMGMMMLPPAMISLPFKILLFILADGFGLVIKSVIDTIR
jgi:flagellar biosynthesis protein FliP